MGHENNNRNYKNVKKFGFFNLRIIVKKPILHSGLLVVD